MNELSYGLQAFWAASLAVTFLLAIMWTVLYVRR